MNVYRKDMINKMLELKRIKKDYPAGSGTVHALKGVDMRFRSAEFVSILGPSGCGKTTLLNISADLTSIPKAIFILTVAPQKGLKIGIGTPIGTTP